MHVNSKDFEAAFELIEGPYCLEASLNPARGRDSETIKKARDRFAMLCDTFDPEFDDAPYCMDVIYGDGGLNRYYVEIPTGEVYFSSMHSTAKNIETARALGLQIR